MTGAAEQGKQITTSARRAEAPVSCGDVSATVNQQEAKIEIALTGSVNERILLVAEGNKRRHFAKNSISSRSSQQQQQQEHQHQHQL